MALLTRSKRSAPQISSLNNWSQFEITALKNQVRDNQTEQTRLKEEIGLEHISAQRLMQDISVSVSNVESDVAVLASQLEEEIQKNVLRAQTQHLLIELVRHYQNSIHTQRIEGQANQGRTCRSVFLERRSASKTVLESQLDRTPHTSLKTLEKNLEELNLKANASLYEASLKRDGVRAERSERAVLSNLFHKLQIELLGRKMDYRQLLIERTVEERLCSQCTEQFNVQAVKAQRLMSKTLSRQNSSLKDSGIIKLPEKNSSVLSRVKMQGSVGIKTIDRTSPKQKDKESSKTLRILNAKEQERMNNLFLVRSIFNDFQVSSASQLPESVELLETEVDSLFETLNHYSNQIARLQAQVNSFQYRTYELPEVAGQIARQLPQKRILSKLEKEVSSMQVELEAFEKGEQFNELCAIFAVECPSLLESLASLEGVLNPMLSELSIQSPIVPSKVIASNRSSLVRSSERNSLSCASDKKTAGRHRTIKGVQNLESRMQRRYQNNTEQSKIIQIIQNTTLPHN